METLSAKKGEYNLRDYETVYQSFNWKDVEKDFTWHATGRVNIAYETIDKHAEGFRKNKVALIYKDEKRKETYTFHEMKEWSNRAGNVFKDFGAEKGDRIFFYMPRIPELYFTLLGAIKIGAIVGPLFEAYMERALRDRLLDSGARILVTTSDLLPRIPEKDLPHLEKIFIVGEDIVETDKYIDLKKRMERADKELDLVWVDREDGFLIQYTSGSTGEQKGVFHVHNIMLQLYITGKWVLDLKEDDIYWCTADPGWITGISYGVFAPWLNGTTNCIIGEKFNPDAWYSAIEELGVTVWYSTPAAFRMLMGAGKSVAEKYNLTSLRHILSVGEPLNPEIIRWGMEVFKVRIHDTWWMTETGAIMISNFPGMEIRPGSMGKPIPGVEAAIVDQQGNKLPPNKTGQLAFKKGWPSMLRKIWNNPEKLESYLLPNGWFISGDSAYMDKDGYFWFQGRMRDVIVTSGERVNPFEVESCLLEHQAIREVGVIGKPDPVDGEIIKAFIVLKENVTPGEELKEELKEFVKNSLSVHAVPREIEFVDQLPKTRSGKIMRRVLKSWGNVNLNCDESKIKYE